MNRPTTIDGALSRMSLMKRTTWVMREKRPYSAMKVPARMPIGVPIRTASVVMIRLPTIGLSRPPSDPGGGVVSVNTFKHKPPRPREQRRPEEAGEPAETDRGRPERQDEDDAVGDAATPIEARRAAVLDTHHGAHGAHWRSPDPALDPQQQVAGRRENDEG